MGKDVGIVRVDMIFKGHVSKTETGVYSQADDLPVSYAAAR